ncbi:MAG: guanylate kinase, partial [Bacteroidales bacterium]|nr:guanylate kinase [Bacteroidales bacterium]
EVLEQRLRKRGTDSEESIRHRLERSALELKEAVHFDHTIVNDNLAAAVKETETIIKQYLKG